MRLISCLTVLCMSVLMSSCGGDSSSKEMQELNKARALWNSAALKDYQYQFRKSCFCLPDYTRKILVYVKDGSVYQAFYVDGGEVVDGEQFDELKTMDQWFSFIAQEEKKSPYKFLVTYSPDNGHPTKIEIDYDKNMADEEMYYYFSDFM
jgi:hypothetical protein